MHSLYRCRCAVGYRPYASSKLIVFSEKQVVDATVNMRWNPNGITLNADYETEASQFVNSLGASTVNVTLSDPYMTGIAWAALFDSAAAYGNVTQAAANHILLPACKEGETSASGKCRPFPEIEDPLSRRGGLGNFAHILVKLYYDVAGVKFGMDSYFRLQGFNIVHGKSYPQVSLSGVHPQVVTFNQSLQNIQLEENRTLEENLQKIVEEQGYQVSFCTDPTDTDTKRYVMPQSFKEKNVTAGEVIKKYLDSVGGNYLSLPTAEYARKISMCTRANINQGCSVFYLGVGLYEGYSISGNVDPNTLNLNLEYDMNRGLGYDYSVGGIKENEKFTIDEIYPQRREAKFKKARTDLTSFPGQFDVLDKRFSDKYSSSGLAWKSSGPEVTTERLQKVNMYGISVTGSEPVALLDGKIVSPVSADQGHILIGTNYFLRFCNEQKKCKNSSIYQHTTNLTNIDVNKLKMGSKVEMNQKLGEASSDKPEFVRFYVPGVGQSDTVTISPSIVWKYAIPVKELTDEELKDVGLVKAGNPQSPSNQSPSSLPSSIFVAKVGNTGTSTNSHVHIEWTDRRRITESDAREYVSVSGNVTSGFGPRQSPTPGASTEHKGIDIGATEGTPIYLINGSFLKEVNESNCQNGDKECGGRFGNYITISTPKGDMRLAHLAPSSITGTPGQTSSGSGYGTGVQSTPVAIGANIQTEFKGIPRALRIVPGRTILSFITNYDEWVEKGRPSDIDPGVWIAGRFSKWFVKDATYKWSQGDLLVSISGVSDWGNATSRIKIPRFEEYISSFAKTELEYKDYYGYIRSLGDLCWKLGDGRTSCEVLCAEAQQITQSLGTQRDSGASVTSEYPPANCQYRGAKYPKDRVNSIINAARQGGINTKAGYAGVVGNAIAESSGNLDPASDNKNRNFLDSQGRGCIGIFQWCDRKVGLDRLASSTGKPWTDFNLQMQWFVQELKGADYNGPETVKALNSAGSPEQAADRFDEFYERSGGQASLERQQYAREIYNDLDCGAA